MTREEWLLALVAELRNWYQDELPETVRISTGFPSKGARSKTIGECWKSEAAADGLCQIFVHPKLSDSADVASVVAHELIHACRPEAKHGAKFKQLAHAIGLEGDMRSTVPGDRFRTEIAPILAELGPYPHASLNGSCSSAGPKQSTRMLKTECPDCGYTVRTTQKWLDVAVPRCPVDDIEMIV